MNDLRQTPEYAKHLKSIGWTVETISGTNYFIKKIPLIGSVIKVQRPEILKYKDIEKLSKKYKPWQIVIEPKDNTNSQWLKTNGYKINKSSFLPSKTLQIDLTLSREKLLSELHKKTHYNVGIAKKRDVEIIFSKDIKKFVKFWHECHRKRMMFLSQVNEITSIYNAFRKTSDLIFATYTGKLVAALMVINCGKICYYMYAASSPTGKKLFAPTLVTWEGILKSKSRGVKVFDFEGIYDERFPIKSWRGFDHFKKSFGGYEVEYPGTYTKMKLPF